MRRAVALLVVALVAGGCGRSGLDQHATATQASTTQVAGATFATTLVNGKPHFATPEEAMRFLADAWNRRDLVNLKHVTDPGARDELETMHGVAVNLRLNHCDKNDAGDYTCFFDHDYPPHPSTTMPLHDHGATGQAVFLVGPADTPGWYMTVFESCS